KQGIIEHYGVPEDKILVTHIPALPVAPLPEAERKAELQKLGLSKPFILFVGTIDPRKNVIGLIDAYRALPKKLRDEYSLVIVGRIEINTDAELSAIKSARQEGYDVVHAGYVSDQTKHALYHSASLFVSASKYEGFGMPLLEAMSYGIPCAFINIPAFTEI